jgi:hypothetical protein
MWLPDLPDSSRAPTTVRTGVARLVHRRRSAVVIEGRHESFWTCGNRAMGAGAVVLDVFGDGDPPHR